MNSSLQDMSGEEINLEKEHESDRLNQHDANWYELRLPGKFPDRRAYHSTFLIDDK